MSKLTKVAVTLAARKAGAIGVPAYYSLMLKLKEPITQESVRSACYDAGYEHISSIRWQRIDNSSTLPSA